jgi:hypothetical protein
MKKYKKFCLGVSLLLLSALFLALVYNPSKALADATAADLGSGKDTFTAIDGATIQGTLGNSGNVTFIDNDPYPQDTTYNFVPSPKTADGLCDPGDVNNQNGVSGKIRYGITLTAPVNLKAATLNVEVKLGYGSGQLGCVPVLFKDTVANSGSLLAATYQWSGNTITRVAGFSPSTYTLVSGQTNILAADSSPGTCGGGAVIVVNASNPNLGTIYALTKNKNSSNGTDASSVAALKPVFPTAGQCYLYSNFFGTPTESIVIAGTQDVGNKGGTTSTGTENSNSSCVDDKSLAWMLCPIINGITATADKLDGFISSQLNFSVSENLSGSVEKAWTVFRTITTIVLVIVMLVMVFSQAIGGGPFDAYTVRKLLPKLVAAVILMQISWELCVYAIRLSNDAGQAIGTLMAAPFGGTSSLELGALLQRLNEAGAAVIGVATTAGVLGGLVAGGVLLAFGWPILLLGMFFVLSAVLVALATLLFRNALIVLLVMLSPLAFLAYVLPGTDKYWKIWKDNFIKLLIFFPLVIALIYAGRIFAWTAAGLGSAGAFDVIMVLIGFFGPYFFLPKTFKWGGNFLSVASKGINESWPVKKAREASTRELSAAQKRKQNELVDKYYQSLVRTPDGKQPGLGLRARAGLKRGMVRAASGHAVPTKRATQVMMQEAGKWKEEEIALREGKYSNDYKELQKGNPSKGIAAMSIQQAKEAVRDLHYDPSGKDALGNRAFFTWAYDTKSFMEMGNKDWRTNNGQYEDMFKTQGWIDFMHGNSNAYGDFSARLGASSVPYRLPLGGGPKAADYMPGGKRYNILGYENAVEQNDDGTVKVDGNNEPIYIKDQEGKYVPNIHYNPGLKRLVDAGGPKAGHFAELEADSERFTKLIDQAEDPAGVVSQRPEEFEQLKNITVELAGAGVGSVGAVSLKKFIDKESLTLGGRNILQRLTGAAMPHIDGMLGTGYVQDKITTRYGSEEMGGGGGAPSSGGGGGAPSSGGGGGAPSSGGGGGAPSSGGGGGAPSSGGGGGAPSSGGGGGNFNQPVELRIDHDALADTIREASRQGTIQGMKHATRDLNLGGGRPFQTYRPQQNRAGEQQASQEDSSNPSITPEEFGPGGKYPPPSVG